METEARLEAVEMVCAFLLHQQSPDVLAHMVENLIPAAHYRGHGDDKSRLVTEAIERLFTLAQKFQAGEASKGG